MRAARHPCRHLLHGARAPPAAGPTRRGRCGALSARRYGVLPRLAAAAPEAPAAVTAVTEQEGAPPQAPQRHVATLSEQQLAGNAELADRLRGKLILAPLTRGGNLPFRRLCADFGAEVTMSEMVFARQLLRGNPIEKTRLRHAANEQLYGFQVATNTIDEGVRASQLALEAGAGWCDINVGCPIHEASKRGMGAVLLRKPQKLARLVAGIAQGSALPLTVKVRIGAAGTKVNLPEVVDALQEAGIAAITVHGRTMEQRYKKPANWQLISDTAASSAVPIIGNGDVLTHYEVERRMQTGGCLAVMTGRGALIKPWLFWEAREGRELAPTATDRVEIYRRLVAYMKEHFGDDARGRQKAWSFLPWHFDWFTRYRPLPEGVYREQSEQVMPLLSMRQDLVDERLGETLDSLPLLERLLRCVAAEAHEAIAATLWDSASDSEAVARLEAAADASLLAWEEAARGDRREASPVQG